MKKFSKKEKMFLIAYEDRISLRGFARRFNCTWQEVYRCYNELTKTEFYKRFVDKRREKVLDYKLEAWKDAYKSSDEKIGETVSNETRTSKELFDPHSPATTNRAMFDYMWASPVNEE